MAQAMAPHWPCFLAKQTTRPSTRPDSLSSATYARPVRVRQQHGHETMRPIECCIAIVGNEEVRAREWAAQAAASGRQIIASGRLRERLGKVESFNGKRNGPGARRLRLEDY